MAGALDTAQLHFLGAFMPAPSPSRVVYIDWLRGLACLVMFQTHCYDAWLGGAARKSKFFMWSQIGGTLPAPLFLFLAWILWRWLPKGYGRKARLPGRALCAPSAAG